MVRCAYTSPSVIAGLVAVLDQLELLFALVAARPQQQAKALELSLGIEVLRRELDEAIVDHPLQGQLVPCGLQVGGCLGGVGRVAGLDVQDERRSIEPDPKDIESAGVEVRDVDQPLFREPDLRLVRGHEVLPSLKERLDLG